MLDSSCLPTTCSGAEAGTCDDTDGAVSCVCNDGYVGTYCETCDADYHLDATGACVADASCADEDPCVNGTCDDTGGVVSCVCDDGYAGDECSTCAAGWHDAGGGVCVLDAECLPNSCSGIEAGTCDDTDGVVTCVCNSGYAGDACESCATDFQFDSTGACVEAESCADADPCVNGTCDDSTGVISCACDDGYAGADCDTCAAGWHDEVGVCVLDAVCTVGSCSGAAAGTCDDTGGILSCVCTLGYAGDDCEACDTGYHFDSTGACVVDESCLAADPCISGTCDDTGGVISCVCDAGYAGADCDTCAAGWHDAGGGVCALDAQCLPSTCSGADAGSCDDTGGIVTCSCTLGYAGTYCETCDGGYHFDSTGACVVDESCLSADPCVNGVCDDTGGLISCVCDDGYAGADCDTCAPGWHDDAGVCVLNETCLPGLCSPNGACDDSTGIVECLCDEGYAPNGELECELSITEFEFSYTGAAEEFTVPAGVTSISIDARGAAGGTGRVGGAGGLGGRVQATLSVTPGDTLYVYVGGAGALETVGGFNGGGVGEPGSASAYGGGSGGGASDVRLNGTALGDRVLVAGGGGGGGADGCTAGALGGGAGGGLTAVAGAQGNGCSCPPSGEGGSPSAGGAKGSWACASNCNSTDGALGLGGDGNSSSSCGGTTGGAGGGGGYYGGGGGGLGAGGGGSSYTDPGATSVVHTQAFQAGAGAVTITTN